MQGKQVPPLGSTSEPVSPVNTLYQPPSPGMGHSHADKVDFKIASVDATTYTGDPVEYIPVINSPLPDAVPDTPMTRR